MHFVTPILPTRSLFFQFASYISTEPSTPSRPRRFAIRFDNRKHCVRVDARQSIPRSLIGPTTQAEAPWTARAHRGSWASTLVLGCCSCHRILLNASKIRPNARGFARAPKPLPNRIVPLFYANEWRTTSKLWGAGAFFLPPQGMYYPVSPMIEQNPVTLTTSSSPIAVLRRPRRPTSKNTVNKCRGHIFVNFYGKNDHRSVCNSTKFLSLKIITENVEFICSAFCGTILWIICFTSVTNVRHALSKVPFFPARYSPKNNWNFVGSFCPLRTRGEPFQWSTKRAFSVRMPDGFTTLQPAPARLLAPLTRRGRLYPAAGLLWSGNICGPHDRPRLVFVVSRPFCGI